MRLVREIEARRGKREKWKQRLGAWLLVPFLRRHMRLKAALQCE